MKFKTILSSVTMLALAGITLFTFTAQAQSDRTGWFEFSPAAWEAYNGKSDAFGGTIENVQVQFSQGIQIGDGSNAYTLPTTKCSTNQTLTANSSGNFICGSGAVAG